MNSSDAHGGTKQWKRRRRRQKASAGNSSVSSTQDVIQISKKTRDILITARVSEVTNAARRGRSWGNFIEDLALRRMAGVIPASDVQRETLRCMIWIAANLDRLARRYCSIMRSGKCPGGPAPVTDSQTAELLRELAELRRIVNELVQ